MSRRVIKRRSRLQRYRAVAFTRLDVYDHFKKFVLDKYPDKATAILDPLNKEMEPHLKLSMLMKAAQGMDDDIPNELKIQICTEMQNLNSSDKSELFDYMTDYLEKDENEEVRLAALRAFNTHVNFSTSWAKMVELSEFSTYEGQVVPLT